MTRTSWMVLSFLVAAGCTRHNGDPAGVGGNGPLPADADGGASDDAGGDSAGDMAMSAPLPMPAPGNYSATSAGLLANSCTAPPDGADLGLWSLKVVNPTVWNLTLAKGLAPAVLERAGALFVGQTAETGMPIWGCTMRETYELTLAPTSMAHAEGRLDTVFSVVEGDCSMYEPVLPCTQSYAVALDRAN
jgi:hypothetical protein